MSNELDFAQFSFGTQVRKSPYSDAALRWGAKGFSVYNHMYIPRDFGDPSQNFWNLVNEAILCDVAVERQVEIKGPDAAKFTQFLSCRDLSKTQVGQCKYVLITDQDGGIINDPILLKLAEDHFWLSIADSDVLLWAKGIAVNSGMDVEISEPDVSPLQLQGPKSRDVLRAAFGQAPTELKYYRFMEYDWNGVPLIISRTGWSSELGYEIFCHPDDASKIWDAVWQAGEPHGLLPLGLDALDMVRIEAGLIFAGYEFCDQTDPFEAGIGFTVPLKSKEDDFIGRQALEQRKANPQRKLVGLELEGNETAAHGDCVRVGRAQVGVITSAMRSPILRKNIALCRIDTTHSELGTEVEVGKLDGQQKRIRASVVPFPFYDPKKERVRA